MKYNLLNDSFLPARASRGVKSVNIYINIDDFFHKLHKPFISNEFELTGQNVYKEMVSNFINLIGHYKNWAVKENLTPAIYLIYTTSRTFKNTVRIRSYRDHYLKITEMTNEDFFHVNSIVMQSIRLLPAIVKYIPHAYVIDSKYLEPSMIPMLLSDMYQADWNLLVTRDEFDYQYLAFDNWSIISPRGMESLFMSKNNLWDVVSKSARLEEPVYFDPAIYLPLKAIIGDKYRGIPRLARIGWKTAIKWMGDVANKAGDDIYEIQMAKLSQLIEKRKVEGTSFRTNFYCTSVREQADAIMDIDRSLVVQQIQDFRDDKSLAQANIEIFKEYPLNLHFLLRDAPAAYYKRHDDYSWRKSFLRDRDLDARKPYRQLDVQQITELTDIDINEED